MRNMLIKFLKPKWSKKALKLKAQKTILVIL